MQRVQGFENWSFLLVTSFDVVYIDLKRHFEMSVREDWFILVLWSYVYHRVDIFWALHYSDNRCPYHRVLLRIYKRVECLIKRGREIYRHEIVSR